ncbi:hypothetical protein GCM10009524_28460 [Spirilliplanes yamanashiensis]
MPVPDSAAPWVGSLLWLIALMVSSFVVTWVCTDRLGMRRTPYIGVLALMTAALGAGYLAWLGVGAADLLTANWVWGLLGAPVAGLFLALAIRRLPGGQRLTGRRLTAALGWEALVYGTTEGVLLSVLPVLMTWQMIHSLGWSGPGGVIARGTLPIAASLAVIVVHHLGYWEYRNHLLRPIALGCGLMSVAYLVTGSPIAPMLAHVISHAASLYHGAEMPPHTRGAAPESYGLESASSGGRSPR